MMGKRGIDMFCRMGRKLNCEAVIECVYTKWTSWDSWLVDGLGLELSIKV